MRIDLEMVAELGAELGFGVRYVQPEGVDLALEPGVVLVFRNLPEPNDCLVGFEGFGWHFHGLLTCSDQHGCGVDLSYLDVITGLANGTVLVCELVADGSPRERWLAHRDYLDEFRHMDAGDEIRVRRVKVGGCGAGGRRPRSSPVPTHRDPRDRE